MDKIPIALGLGGIPGSGYSELSELESESSPSGSPGFPDDRDVGGIFPSDPRLGFTFGFLPLELARARGKLERLDLTPAGGSSVTFSSSIGSIKSTFLGVSNSW